MLTWLLIFIVICLSKGEKPHWTDLGGYTYFISDQFDLNLKFNYTEASLYCQNMSSHLASVHSLEETDFLLHNTATDDSAWIGLHHIQPTDPTDCNCTSCPDTEEPPSDDCVICTSCRGADKWQWEDGTVYDWTNWNLNQPSDFNNEMCARFHGDGKWYDDPCSKRHEFICKKAMKTSNNAKTSTEFPTSTTTGGPATNPTALPRGSGDNNNMSAIVGGVVAAAIALIIVVVGFIILWKIKCPKKKALHNYINTDEYVDIKKPPQDENSFPMGHGISPDYADADVEDIGFYAASDVVKNSDDAKQYCVQVKNEIYNESENQPEVEDGAGALVYAVVDNNKKKKNRNKPTKPPRTKKKKGQAPAPPVNADSGAVYTVPTKGKKAKKKDGSNQNVQGETNEAMLYAEPKKKSKQNAGQQVVSSSATEGLVYEDVENKETEGKPKPKAKPRKE